MQTHHARRGLLMVMFAAVLWGTGGIAAKSIYALSPTNPTSVAFFRMALSVPLLLVLCWVTLGRRMWDVQRQDLPRMLIAGALVALYQVAYFAAIPRVGVAISTLVALCSAPISVAVLSSLVTRERPPALVLLALGLAIIGTVLLVQVPANDTQSAQQSDMLGGVLLSVLSGGLYAINTLVGRKLGGDRRVHPLQTTTAGFAFGSVLLLGIGLSAGLVVQYPVEGWLGLIYLGVFPTAIAYGLFYAGMRSISATHASIATFMEPLTATIIATLLFNEPLNERTLLGSLFLIVAMGIIIRKQ